MICFALAVFTLAGGMVESTSPPPPLYLIESTRVFSLLTCGTPKATSLCWGRKVKKRKQKNIHANLSRETVSDDKD